jgi:hypothetical protein
VARVTARRAVQALREAGLLRGPAFLCVEWGDSREQAFSVVGKWIVQGVKKVGQFITRNGKTIEDNPEDLADE